MRFLPVVTLGPTMARPLPNTLIDVTTMVIGGVA